MHSRLQAAGIIAIASAPFVALVIFFETVFGWFADASPEEIIIYALAQIVPGIAAATIAAFRDLWGPEWREGKRRCDKWDAAETRRSEIFRAGQRHIRERFMNDPAKCQEALMRWDYELPPNPEWHPPPGFEWDGSCSDRGIENPYTVEARNRWPAWFARHERPPPINAQAQKEIRREPEVQPYDALVRAVESRNRGR
jgi:hypothetical protein